MARAAPSRARKKPLDLANSSSNGGCLSGVFGLLVFVGVAKLCGSSSDNKGQTEAEQQAIREDNARHKTEIDGMQTEDTAKAEKLQAGASQRTKVIADLKALKPWQRAEVLHKCSNDSSTCPMGGEDAVYEAAANPTERSRLEKN